MHVKTLRPGMAVRPARVRPHRHEICDVITHMLVEGMIRSEVPANLGIYLVPRTSDLPFQVTAKRIEILAEFLALATQSMTAPHPLVMRHVLERDMAPLGVHAARLPPRTLHDQLGHVLAHQAI